MEFVEHRNQWEWGVDTYLVTTDGMGFVGIGEESGRDYAYIHNLCVHRKARRKGYGRALMEQAFILAERHQYNSVRLFRDGPCWLDDWYRHLGFRETGRKVGGLVEYERPI